MKKTIFIAVLLVLSASVMAQDVTIKRGKVTMSEADYNLLKQKADAYENAQKALDETLAAYQKQQSMNDMYRPIVLKDFNDSASYAIGKDIYQSWLQQNLGINGQAAGQSMIDCYKGQNTWTNEMMRPLLNRFQQEFEKRQRAEQDKMMASKDENIDKGKKFLQENALNKSIYTTKSGLQYKIAEAGDQSQVPAANDTAFVHYTLRKINGELIQELAADQPSMQMVVSNSAGIPGFIEGLSLVGVGGKETLYVPYKLGYGENGTRGGIGPCETLVFDVVIDSLKRYVEPAPVPETTAKKK